MALLPNVSYSGNVGASFDGTSGSATNGGEIDALVPEGSTVLQAFLYATTYATEQDIAVTLSSGVVSSAFDDFTSLGENSAQATPEGVLTAYRTDVTDLVEDVVGNGDDERFIFEVDDVTGRSIDGFALVVIYSNVDANFGTISILDGFSDPDGDSFSIDFGQPITDPEASGFRVELSLGIGYGFQPSEQSSEITVNGELLTSSAGGQDDGVGENGGLITIGGLDDTPDNPDPNAGPLVQPGFDDELYDLSSFLEAGDSSIEVATINPSDNDNIFFAALITNPPTQVVTEAPTAVADRYKTAFETQLSVAAGEGVLANDTDDGSVIGALIETNVPVTDGTLQLFDDGSFVFNPAAGFDGETSFTYRAQDDDGLLSFPQTATITVQEGPFDFNVATAMQLAAAAYTLHTDSDGSISADEGPNIGQSRYGEAEYARVFDGSTDLRPITPIDFGDGSLINSTGLYLNENGGNAGALLARTDDALVISFRGTNDLTGAGLAEALIDVTGVDAATETAKGRFKAFTKLVESAKALIAKDKGVAAAKLIEAATDILFREVEKAETSPDVQDWFNLSDHWALFSELIDAIPGYLSENPDLTQVYVTGHSLGGSMVENFMIEHPDGFYGVQDIAFEAYSFASPGIDYGNDLIEDDRLLNVVIDNDIIRVAGVATERTGDTLVIDVDVLNNADLTEVVDLHLSDAYLAATQLIYDAGLTTGDRLTSPEADAESFDVEIERVQVSFTEDSENGFKPSDGADILSGLGTDAIIGTAGEDKLISDLYSPVVLAGLEGDDEIDLESILAQDIIVFRRGDGSDTVSGFDLDGASADLVALYGFGSALDPQIGSVNGDLPFTFNTTVNFGNGDAITFNGLNLDEVESLLENNVAPTDAFDSFLIA